MLNPRRLAALALVLALSLAACGASAPSSGAQASPTGGTPSSAPGTTSPAPATSPTGEPGATDAVPTDAVPSDEPVATDPVATDEPTPPVDPSASPVASPGPAGACSGSDKNREFYASVALAVKWPVLCAVLPKGWNVSTGSYRLANGGKLIIGYKGPSGATLGLSEGAYCPDGTGCVPAGTDGDEVPLGPLTGTLVRLADGGFAIVVDRGANPSWLLEAHGLDEATTLAFGAALVEVALAG